MMGFIDEDMIFNENEIYFIDGSGQKQEVMMSWENEIMKASAEFICQNGGDILEIGFGMGISANYIQSHNIKSHTIIEIHPQIIDKLKIWAKDKANVIIIEGGWYENMDKLKKYDGILMDVYGDTTLIHFKESINKLVKDKTLLTWFNSKTDKYNIFRFDNVDYEILNVDAPTNFYFNNNKYYLPKKQF